MAGKLNLKINQGETYRHSILWKDETKQAVNVSGYTARMHVRENITDSTPLLVLTTEGGVGTDGTISLPSPQSNGEIRLYISAEKTASITWSSGVYDLEMVAPNGDVTRLIEGTVSISKEVTR